MAESPFITVRTHPDLMAALDRVAEETDTTLSDVVRAALVQYLDSLGHGRPRAHPPRRRETAA
jgi:hypothetical protein